VSANLLLIVNHEEKAVRLMGALAGSNYHFNTIIIDETLPVLEPEQKYDLAILWFPYSSPEALPEFSGYIAMIQALNPDHPIPVLLIIDRYGFHWVEPGFELGVSDVLTRPIHPLVLRRRVELLLKERKTEEAVRRYQETVTALNENQKTLQLERERFRTVADFTYDWEYWQDGRGNILYISPSCERISGRSIQDFTGNPTLLLDIVHPQDREAVREHFQRERSLDHLPPIDFRILTREGKECWIGHVCQPVFDGEGNSIGRRISNRDITDNKKAELSVLRSERLAAMGQLLASLAHEINNPLQAMCSNLDLVLDYPIDQNEQMEYLQTVREQTNRLMNITASILDFSRLRPVTPEVVRIYPHLSRVITLVGKQIRTAQVKVNLDIPKDLSPVLISSEEFEQVCLNLIINAVENMTEGGDLTIQARNVNDQVKLSFRDTGTGIPADLLTWIFDPFYTTKRNGTGLGLANSQRIIQQYQGNIIVESEEGKGSIFCVTLPASKKDDVPA
jgi:PAS domain S-box-containing protein